MPLMTKKDYAAHRGCKPAYISKKDVTARLAPAMVNQNGAWLVDSEKADAILSQGRDPASDLIRASEAPADGAAKSASSSYTEVRTTREKVRVEFESIELAERKGQTLPRGKVYQAAMALGQGFREALQGRNRRLAEQLSTMKDPREVMVLLEQEDRLLLETLSHDFLRRLQSASGDAPQ